MKKLLINIRYWMAPILILVTLLSVIMGGMFVWVGVALFGVGIILDTATIKERLKGAKSIKKLGKQMRDRHLDRLREGHYQAATAQMFSDMFMALQRVKNHSVNYIEAYAGL